MSFVRSNFNSLSRSELERRLLEVYKQLHIIDVAHNRLIELYLSLHNSLNSKK